MASWVIYLRPDRSSFPTAGVSPVCKVHGRVLVFGADASTALFHGGVEIAHGLMTVRPHPSKPPESRVTTLAP